MNSEARLLADFPLIAIGGANPRDAVTRLIEAGARQLVSFGLAGGLDPAVHAGDVLVPSRVVAGGRDYFPDLALCAQLGGVTAGALLHSDAVVATAVEKRALYRSSGCVALDMESGVVAEAARKAGLGFAVLRAICDPAGRDLPPAARAALRPDGKLDGWAILASLLHKPWQLPDLLGLARDAGAARRGLVARISVFRL